MKRRSKQVDTKAFHKLSYGLYVIGSTREGRLNGQIANTVFQISSNPATVAISINRKNLTNEFIKDSKVFSVSVLAKETPLDFIGHFGFRSGREIDKYKNVSFKMKSGETLSLGKRSLTFIHTPMVHWPDNMISYLPEDKILFSNDAFGQHIATSERFDDQIPLDIILEEAAKYYANIVFPYGSNVQKALEATSDLDIGIIAPSHGIIWRSHIKDIAREYRKWSANAIENKAVIVYDSMWGSTEKIAYAIQEAFENKDVSTRMLNLKVNDISDVMTHILTAKYICVGSPTLNNNMLPTVAAFLYYLKGLAPKKRIGLAFGSYGWGGQSVEQIEEILKSCGFDLMEQIRIQYIPDAKQLTEASAKISESIAQNTSN